MKRRAFLKSVLAFSAAAPLLLAVNLTTGHADPVALPVQASAVPVPFDASYMDVGVESPTAPSRYDPLGQWGFVSYKVRCTSCSRQWGDWEKFTDTVVDLGLLRIPTKDDVRSRAVAHLIDEGWTIDPSPTCPACLGHDYPRQSLHDGMTPIPSSWYTGGGLVIDPDDLRKNPERYLSYIIGGPRQDVRYYS